MSYYSQLVRRDLIDDPIWKPAKAIPASTVTPRGAEHGAGKKKCCSPLKLSEKRAA
jgi:hypothetical protein